MKRDFETVEIKSSLMDDLIIAQAVSSAHYNLAPSIPLWLKRGRDAGRVRTIVTYPLRLLLGVSSKRSVRTIVSQPSIHPGDPFGRTIAWLWERGDKRRVLLLVETYLGEHRSQSPYRNGDGNTLTLPDLVTGINWAIADMEQAERNHLRSFLMENIPLQYGEHPNSLARP